MGQYYKPYVENKDGKFVLYSHDYGNGLKLMEHSWIGNDFVNAVYTLIYGKPSKVGWIGDYSNDVGVDLDLYEYVWGDDNHNTRIRPNDYFRTEDGEWCGKGYLLNHSKMEFIDLEYYDRLARFDVEYFDGAKFSECVNPLPLLTSIGNGLGGGDYHSCYPNYDMCGYWYLDEIEYLEEFPLDFSDYSDVTDDVVFKEVR